MLDDVQLEGNTQMSQGCDEVAYSPTVSSSHQGGPQFFVTGLLPDLSTTATRGVRFRLRETLEPKHTYSFSYMCRIELGCGRSIGDTTSDSVRYDYDSALALCTVPSCVHGRRCASTDECLLTLDWCLCSSPSWTGATCSEYVGPCDDGGTSARDKITGACICKRGFEGDDCALASPVEPVTTAPTHSPITEGSPSLDGKGVAIVLATFGGAITSAVCAYAAYSYFSKIRRNSENKQPLLTAEV